MLTLTGQDDTIVAPATAAHSSALGIIRISGPRAIEITDSLWKGKSLLQAPSHTAHLGYIVRPDREIVDQVVATIFRSPASFTGQDTVEISHHGSPWIRRALLELFNEAGARMALPGEFSQRAFLNGKIDLAQAEGIADLIASSSRAAQRMAMNQMRGQFSRSLARLRQSLIDLASLLELELDFSEEDVEFAQRSKLRALACEIHTTLSRLSRSFATGHAIKEGIPIAIAGPTNAGKSSLLNRLLGDQRAIVSDIHGTTRDTVEETLELGDFLFRFIDTAGLRPTNDPIERIGIERTRQAMQCASIILLVVDPLQPQTLPDPGESPSDGPAIIPVINKTDIAPLDALNHIRRLLQQRYKELPAEISAKTGEGIGLLKERIIMWASDTQRNTQGEEGEIVTNRRHAEALNKADEMLQQLIAGIDAGLSGDLLAQDLREAIYHLGTVTGAISAPELLSTIFSRFCIGK